MIKGYYVECLFGGLRFRYRCNVNNETEAKEKCKERYNLDDDNITDVYEDNK